MNDRELVRAGYRYALSLCARPHDAEDLVQEACLRLYRRLDRLPDRPLLFTAIRNLYIDQYRRGKLLRFEPLLESASAAPTGDDARLDAGVELAELAGPLSRLRDEEREALFLNAVEEYSAREIAELTGRPRGTVLSLIHRAKKKLRAALGVAVADRPRRRDGAAGGE